MAELGVKVFKPHPLRWIVEPLEEEPSYLEKAMFGARGCYLHGRLVLVLAAREEPWKGLLVPTEKKYHSSLQEEIPGLRVHTILGKWLYISEEAEDFEDVAKGLIELITAEDPRVGVLPKPRQKAKAGNRIGMPGGTGRRKP
jgi:hypothetical protein